MHHLSRIFLCGIIIGSDIREGGGRCSRNSGGMQDKCVGFGLPSKLVDVPTGYGLTSKMSDETDETQNDGKIVSLEFVIVGCKIWERSGSGT